ncbi:hypothetical protein VHEMI07382 [[Torrubiella] hemipterigena]|uniref:Uncharacterized protein n=1 Tax=[Torrubiella] hemipterigena TaxID=1531966 RepID=A0A0A1T3G3_9HYPO|nr:hypothetical protein VHEMI07382 [[Torrubiella] hemipterigena]
MVAAPYNQFRPVHDPFNVYHDAANLNTHRGSLPQGGCNFVDLTQGAAGTRCGCRKYWSRQTIEGPNPAISHQGWCMCNHHACFHDDRLSDEQVAPIPIASGQENEKPKPLREPLSPMIDVQSHMPQPAQNLGFPSFSAGGAPLSFIHDNPMDFNNGISQNNTPQVAPSLPDTIHWGDFVQSQVETSGLPPIPAQCLLASQTASTTSSVQAKYLRPFAGKGLNTLGPPAPRAPIPPSPLSNKFRTPLQVQREVETSAMVIDQGSSTPMTTITTQIEPRSAAKGPSSREVLKNVTETLGSHEQRLDRLETTSFAAPAHDECHEKHEHFDLRITDVEGKLDELLEKQINDDGAVSRRGDRRDDDATTQSGLSVVSDATSRPTRDHDLLAQIKALQDQVLHLQSLSPSHNNPWEIEVVFLPFPLKRVWQDMHQFKIEPNASSDDWTQLPMTMSSSPMRAQTPMFGDWATSDHEIEWLLPKACADTSVTDQRLRSRGLIKTVSVRGTDARSIQAAINNTFASVFEEMQVMPRSHETDQRLSKFHGLQSFWVPLRKIHKESRLRFLSPAEMITPAVWDASFLNSVMMRSSQRRLFITHPDAYLQDRTAYDSGWTWQRIRELTRVYPGSDASQRVPEADALEDHWSWNEQMDEPISANNSGNFRQQHRISRSPSFAQIARIERWRSQSPAILRDSTPMGSGRRGSMPPHLRTMSGPVVPPARPSPLEPPRRNASMTNYHRYASPAVRVGPNGGIMKPRRTRSPSFAQATPRWTTSPSPAPWASHERHGQRGMTPFAYATPYSATPVQDPRATRSGSTVRFDAQHRYYDDDGQGEYYGNFGAESADDEDIDVYEDDVPIKRDESDSDNDIDAVPMAERQGEGIPDSGDFPCGDDDPWPGIEDQPPSDGENVDPKAVGRESAASSQPSEYPSTQPAWPAEPDDFSIHEDA